jgi:magnesium chelatase family protein
MCSCSPSQIVNYQRKISGPILDRIDLQIEVPRLKFDKLQEECFGEGSAEIRDRVQRARDIQKIRFKGISKITNSEMSSNEIKMFCPLSAESLELLKVAVTKMGLSARAYYRLIKIARTIADLSEEKDITPMHIAESIQYRFKNE